MIKKAFTTLGIVLLLSFASCEGGSSKEAKALLQKILQFKGIPQEILVNVCQDSNKNGICGSGELFTKVTINKGDNINDIWQKISLTSDGRYFLETYNPELPILVEFQDIAKVNFDDGNFTLSFNGFTTKEDDNEIKEVSVLESMVDANALSKDIADKFRTLNNSEAQEKYYSALFESLETNINTLRREEFDKEEAINATIKEMGEETITNQEQANRINSCENNQSCVDEEIKKVSDELLISDEEIVEIKGEENNSSTPTPVANGEEVVYGKWVKPSRSVCESNGGIYIYNQYNNIYDCKANWENARIICSASGDILPNMETLRAVVTDCGGDINDYDNNANNEAYQTCYREKGFGSLAYWSVDTFKDEDTDTARVIAINNSYENWQDKIEVAYLRCSRN